MPLSSTSSRKSIPATVRVSLGNDVTTGLVMPMVEKMEWAQDCLYCSSARQDVPRSCPSAAHKVIDKLN